ncbi:nucleotidyltransferase family protein [Limibacter armeniacum]|uniref:nucleotidyltransferase family protein n=1 Tax=Limibacter armeniacum TaxID=466084 RepID=UPI002FE67DBD
MGLAAIVLSAGASSRMGQAKQLLMIENKPIIQHMFDAIESIEFELVCCVLGANSEKIAPVLSDQVQLVYNEHWSLGLSESIKAGIQYVLDMQDIDGVFLFLADQPFILTKDINNMLAIHSEYPDRCVATSYGNSPGVPAILPRKYFSSLLNISGDKGAKSLLSQLSEEVVLYKHKGELIDIDTIEDYRQALSR